MAKTAEEAWPDKGTAPDPLSADEIARGCEAFSGCFIEPGSQGTTEALQPLDACVTGVVWSAERAIPMSHPLFGERNERAEFFIRCALESADSGDCDLIRACLTTRAVDLNCEEDGCRAEGEGSYFVSCNGDLATMERGGKSATRDCARAFATCDHQSATGCSDRHLTACPSDIERSDRCDGEVLLGCDGEGQVSYRDCARMGGECGVMTSGVKGCVYGSAPDAACSGDSPKLAACAGSDVSVCVAGKRVTVPAPSLCGS